MESKITTFYGRKSSTFGAHDPDGREYRLRIHNMYHQ
jgi:hypothetical protein